MSSPTDWRNRCPHGHTDVYRRQPEHPFAHGRPEEYWCRSCSRRGIDAHYWSKDMNRQTASGSNVSLGYVWTPSHDE